MIKHLFLIVLFIVLFDSAVAQTAVAADISTSPTITGPTYRDPVTGMEFVLVKGGCFPMGDIEGSGRDNERPVHEVCVDDFYMGKYEVTQDQWKTIMGSNPSSGKRSIEYPVNEVSWINATMFASQLSNKTGVHYRLPTEAEWEYAARSRGSNDKWPGTNNEADLMDYAWYSASKERDIHPVGLKKPNDLGLYDMAGNLKEWVSDWYYDKSYSTSQIQNPRGPHSDIVNSWSKKYGQKVVRGGDVNEKASAIRSSYRDKDDVDRRHEQIGFRLAIQISSAPTEAYSTRFQPSIQPGDRVRITIFNNKKIFIVDQIRSDIILVKPYNDSDQSDNMLSTKILMTPSPYQSIRIEEIEHLELLDLRFSSQNTANDIGRNVVMGSLIGAITFASVPAGLVGAGVGEVVGTVLSTTFTGKQWRDIEYAERLPGIQASAGTVNNEQSGSPESTPDPSHETGSEANGPESPAPARKLTVGFFFPYTQILHPHLRSSDRIYLNSLDNGAGLGIRLRFGLTEHSALEWSSAVTSHSLSPGASRKATIQNQVLSSTELSLRYVFSSAVPAINPAILAGLGYHCLGDTDYLFSECHYQGLGQQLGLGIEFPLNMQSSLSAGLSGRRIVFDRGKWIGTGSVLVNTVTIDIGLTARF